MINRHRMRFFLAAFLLCLCLYAFPQAPKDTLIVGYTTAPPFIVQNEDELQGINIWLWNEVADELDQPFVLKNMEFAEMLEALRTAEIDLSINPLTITSSRSENMEFTHSYFASNSTIAIAELSSMQKVVGFIKGFLNRNFLRGFIVLMMIIIVFGLAGWYFERRRNPQFRRSYKGIWDGLWWSMVTLTTVGYGDKSPKSIRGKVTALILMFTGLLFISGLTASIASSLTVDRLSEAEVAFEAFKKQKVGTVRNTSSATFLRDQFFRDIELYDGVMPGLYDLRDHKIDAFIYDEPIMKYRLLQDSTFSEISILPAKFDVQFYAFGLPQHKDSLEQVISQKILEIKETQKWKVLLNEYGLTEY